MQIRKKLYTTLIITVLTVSVLMAAIPLASAINAPAFYSDIFHMDVTSGNAYTTGSVHGDGATNFGKVEVYWDTLGTKLAEGYANGTGFYSIKTTIPEDVAGAHDIIVYDVLASDIASMSFTIIPSIMLSTSKALPGDSVTVFASGFGDELDVQLYLGRTPFTGITSVTGESVTLSGTPDTGTLANPLVVITSVDLAVDVTINGTVGGELMAPLVAVTDISVTDDGEGNLEGEALDVAVTGTTTSGLVDVTITGTINYVTGVITLTATGEDAGGTDPVAEIEVTIDACDADYSYAEWIVTPTAGVETSEKGSFMATFVVPAIAEVNYTAYNVIAFDTDGNNALNLVFPPYFPPFTIDYYITLDPNSGPTGITTTIEGRIESDTDYEIRFGAASIATGTSGADGSFTATYVIPAVLPEGDYTVSVVWLVTKSRTATFTVTPPPALTSIVPPSGKPGDVITISGENFTSGADIELYLGTTLVNSTADDDRFGPTGTGFNAGKFTDLEFTVPDIAPGVYVIKVVDENGASTGTAYTFSVTAAPVTTVALRGTTYYPGDTLSFNIFTTEGNLGTMTVTITDPSGATWWTVSAVTTPPPGPWTLTGAVIKRVLYQDQIIGGNPLALPADAPLGNWNWTVAYTPQSTATETKATGLFAVAALPSMQTVIDAIDDCCANLTDLLTALDAKIVAIDDAIATIEIPDLGTIEASLTSLDATITGLDGDIATIKTSIGGVTTSLSTLDAVVGSMYGDLLTINTTVGTIEGTLMDMDGSIATIETDLGTVKLDVAAVQTDVEESLPVTVDMMPVWIAVILSLVAAIAAIFAVITIRQKIAG
jgi:hypothetical protein